MAPPIHVKAVVGLLNAIVIAAGVRNVLVPGTPIPIPEDDVFQAHFHGKTGSDQKMAFVFQLLGAFFLLAAVAKLIATFGNAEGTFLRQKLFLAFGALDLVVAAIVFQYDALPRSVLGGFAALHLLEGAAFLEDALFRARPVKGATKKKK